MFKKIKSYFSRLSKSAVFSAQSYDKKTFVNTVANSVKPLPKVFFSHGRKPVAPFSKILWTEAGYINVIYRYSGNPDYTKVEGFKIDRNLIVLRSCREAYPPSTCYKLAQKFSGRIPNSNELRRIIGLIDRLNASLAMVGEKPVYNGKYLISDTSEKNGASVIDIAHPEIIEEIDLSKDCNFLVVR